jgi:hypothetical protein
MISLARDQLNPFIRIELSCQLSRLATSSTILGISANRRGDRPRLGEHIKKS